MRKFTASTTESGKAVEAFELEGVYEDPDHDPPTWKETFWVRTSPDAKVISSFRNVLMVDENGNQGFNPTLLMDFVSACMPLESKNRFRALMADPSRRVDLAPIGAVFAWISEDIIGRPTNPSQPSSNGTTDTPATPPQPSPPQDTPTPTDT